MMLMKDSAHISGHQSIKVLYPVLCKFAGPYDVAGPRLGDCDAL
jgi:hypothetical protein